jgi:PRC-barrel domain
MTMTAALAAMLAAASPIALAQTAPTTGAAAPGATSGLTPPGQLRFTDLHAAAVYDAQNKKIGPIEEVIFERDGRVAAVVLDVGSFLGIGGKRVAVSLNELRIATDEGGKPRFQLDLTKDQLKSAQAFDLSRPDGAAGSSTPPAGPPRVESGN